MSGAVSRKLKKFCSAEGLYQRVPVIEWLPKYKKAYILQDVVAGLTVAMTVIPQGIADAALAGLPTQYGLYAGFMGKPNNEDLFYDSSKILSFKDVSFISFLEAVRTSQLVCLTETFNFTMLVVSIFHLQVQLRFCLY